MRIGFLLYEILLERKLKVDKSNDDRTYLSKYVYQQLIWRYDQEYLPALDQEHGHAYVLTREKVGVGLKKKHITK